MAAALITLTGCSAAATTTTTSSSTSAANPTVTLTADHETEADRSWDTSKEIAIDLSDPEAAAGCPWRTRSSRSAPPAPIG